MVALYTQDQLDVLDLQVNLNPWFRGSATNAAASHSGVSARRVNQQATLNTTTPSGPGSQKSNEFRAIVMYAWTEIDLDTNQKRLFVIAREPHLHIFGPPKVLPTDNNIDFPNTDWATIRRHHTFEATDTAIIGQGMPRPKDIIKCSVSQWNPMGGFRYLGLVNRTDLIPPETTRGGTPIGAKDAMGNPLAEPRKLLPKATERPEFFDLQHIPRRIKGDYFGGYPNGPTDGFPLGTNKQEIEVKKGEPHVSKTEEAGKGPRSKEKKIDLIVIHCGAIPHTRSDATGGRKGTHRTLEGRGLSTHFTVGKDGSIHMHEDPATITAWHAGGGMNSRCIGIDICHKFYAGFDPKVSDDHPLVFRMPNWEVGKRVIEGEDTWIPGVKVAETGWKSKILVPNQSQNEATYQLVKELVRQFPHLSWDFHGIVGDIFYWWKMGDYPSANLKIRRLARRHPKAVGITAHAQYATNRSDGLMTCFYMACRRRGYSEDESQSELLRAIRTMSKAKRTPRSQWGETVPDYVLESCKATLPPDRTADRVARRAQERA